MCMVGKSARHGRRRLAGRAGGPRQPMRHAGTGPARSNRTSVRWQPVEAANEVRLEREAMIETAVDAFEGAATVNRLKSHSKRSMNGRPANAARFRSGVPHRCRAAFPRAMSPSPRVVVMCLQREACTPMAGVPPIPSRLVTRAGRPGPRRIRSGLLRELGPVAPAKPLIERKRD